MVLGPQPNHRPMVTLARVAPLRSPTAITADGASPPFLSQTAAESVEERRLTEENASQSLLVRAGKKGDSDGLNLSQDKNEKSFLNSPFFIGWGPAPKPPGFFEAYPSCVF